jgi:hypothetical protein
VSESPSCSVQGEIIQAGAQIIARVGGSPAQKLFDYDPRTTTLTING